MLGPAGSPLDDFFPVLFLVLLKYLLSAAGCVTLWTWIGGTVLDFRMFFIVFLRGFRETWGRLGSWSRWRCKWNVLRSSRETWCLKNACERVDVWHLRGSGRASWRRGVERRAPPYSQIPLLVMCFGEFGKSEVIWDCFRHQTCLQLWIKVDGSYLLPSSTKTSQRKHVFLTVCNNSLLFECHFFLSRKEKCLLFLSFLIM